MLLPACRLESVARRAIGPALDPDLVAAPPLGTWPSAEDAADVSTDHLLGLALRSPGARRCEVVFDRLPRVGIEVVEMARDRLARILGFLGDGDDRREGLEGLCRACVTELGVTGAGLTLLVGGQHRGTPAASDKRAVLVEELQFTLGEGPCLEANRTGAPVLEPQLAGSTRWPAFAPEAVAIGVGAVFAVPLQMGAARFGALDLYHDRPGPLGEGVLEDALVVADVATVRVVAGEAHAPAGSLPEVVEEMAEQRAALHQATGMVSVQMDVTLEESLVALRARAYVDGRSVGAVAAEVVARRLRFDP